MEKSLRDYFALAYNSDGVIRRYSLINRIPLDAEHVVSRVYVDIYPHEISNPRILIVRKAVPIYVNRDAMYSTLGCLSERIRGQLKIIPRYKQRLPPHFLLGDVIRELMKEIASREKLLKGTTFRERLLS